MKFKIKIMFLLWCIVLFHPFRLLNNIAGGLSPLFRTQTIILYCMTLLWIFSNEKKVNYHVLMLIVITHIFGTIFIAENTGWARSVTQIIFDAYLLGLITFSFFRDKKYIGTLFDLLTLSFCYWAISNAVDLTI